MSTWSDLGFPYPQAPGYSYSIDAGLVKTAFLSANPRQSRRHQTNKRSFTLEVFVTQEQLNSVTAFLIADGFSWFSMDLLSGQLDGDPVSLHLVRLAESFQVSAVGMDYYKIQMQLEQIP